MDHVCPHTAPVKSVLGDAPLTLPEFSLVSFDQRGYAQPLPPALGHLPLYLEDDGFFSVIGSRDLTVFSPSRALAPVDYENAATARRMTSDIYGFPGESSLTPDRDQRPLNEDAINSEARAGSSRRSYLCHETGCAWRSSFLTKQALDRHHEAKHLNKRVDCLIPGCDRVGDKGVKRKDNLPAHVLNKHGIKLPRQSHKN